MKSKVFEEEPRFALSQNQYVKQEGEAEEEELRGRIRGRRRRRPLIPNREEEEKEEETKLSLSQKLLPPPPPPPPVFFHQNLEVRKTEK